MNIAPWIYDPSAIKKPWLMLQGRLQSDLKKPLFAANRRSVRHCHRVLQNPGKSLHRGQIVFIKHRRLGIFFGVERADLDQLNRRDRDAKRPFLPRLIRVKFKIDIVWSFPRTNQQRPSIVRSP